MKNNFVKVILIITVLTLLVLLIKKIFMKNIECKTENGYELIGYGGKPVDITQKIEKENCECLNRSVLVNPKPLQFNSYQLKQLRKVLPDWAKENIKNFSSNDEEALIAELNMSDTDLLKKIKYKFSYFGKPTEEEIPIYIYSIKSIPVYCPNYIQEYSMYGKKDNFGFEIYPISSKPDYPIVENKDWAKNEFGIE